MMPQYSRKVSQCVLHALVILFVMFPLCAAAEKAQEKVVYLVLEKSRLIASNTLLSRFDELKLDAKEKIVQQREAEAVIVVVTNQRILGYGAYAPAWQPVRIRASEQILSVEAKDASASVLTSDRYLNFNGRRGIWAVKKKRL